MSDEELPKLEGKTSSDQTKINKDKSDEDLPKFEAKTLMKLKITKINWIKVFLS